MRDHRAYAASCCADRRIVTCAIGHVCERCRAYTDIQVSRDEACVAISRVLKQSGARIGCGSPVAAVRRAGFAVERIRVSRLEPTYPPKRVTLDDYVAVREYSAGRKNREALERYAEVLAAAGIATTLLPRTDRTWMLRIASQVAV